jgi:hypothetical protein
MMAHIATLLLHISNLSPHVARVEAAQWRPSRDR